MPDFRVVTHKRWLAEQFKPMGAVQDFGFDIDPATAHDTLWWAPGAWVASAAKAGVTLPLTANGPHWLDNVPRRFTGRTVSTMTIDESIEWFTSIMGEDSIEFFVKLPEAKVDNFPARVHTVNKHWATTIGQYHLPGDTLIQFQGVEEFLIEARFWVAHGRITTASAYRYRDDWWGCEDWDEITDVMSIGHWFKAIHKFAEGVVEDVEGAPGYVLDCGINRAGEILVIEANAAWSSGPYDGNTEGIYEAIKASHDPEGKYPQWAWQPNPVFDKVGALREVNRNERGRAEEAASSSARGVREGQAREGGRQSL